VGIVVSKAIVYARNVVTLVLGIALAGRIVHTDDGHR
jgi:hypothetical protein